jgi:CTD small phosphatase-like protein 2
VTQSNEGKYQQTSASNPYEVASKYYVDELTKNYMGRDSLIREHLFSSMYYLQMLKQYDKTLLYHEGVYVPAINDSSKFTIVFDLDETLVHCNDDDSEPYQIALSVSFSGFNTANAYLNIRPHAREIL